MQCIFAAEAIGPGRVAAVIVGFLVILLVAKIGADRRHNQAAIERMRRQRGSRW